MTFNSNIRLLTDNNAIIVLLEELFVDALFVRIWMLVFKEDLKNRTKYEQLKSIREACRKKTVYFMTSCKRVGG